MFSKLTLEKKLMGLLVGISAIGLGLLLFLMNSANHSIHAEKSYAVAISAEGWIDKLDRNLFERYGDVQAFALSEPARSLVPERITAFMNDMMPTYAPIYDVMIVTDRTGRVIATNTSDKGGKPLNNSALIGKDYSNTEWFKRAISGEIKPATSFIEDLHVDADTAAFAGTDGAVMNFTAPIVSKESGKVIGVWSNRMSWKDVVQGITTEELGHLVDEANPYIYATLLSPDGQYLVNTIDPSLVLKGSYPDFEKTLKTADYKKQTLFERELKSERGSEVYLEGATHSIGYSSYPGVGWYGLIQTPKKDAQVAHNYYVTLIGAVLLGICSIFGFFFARQISSVLTTAASKLHSNSNSLRNAASGITAESQTLAQATTEQSAAIQETASSIEEMNAMIKKNSDNAVRSRDKSNESNMAATKGKEAMGELVNIIDQIQSGSKEMASKIAKNNEQVGDIVKVIQEIGTKTKVINDIVFQTKLLSFNASVEAARAGEHGKGFAVVAEEVGNLAQLSGNAAREIGEMLGESIKKVEAIVSKTKSEVEQEVRGSTQKIESGIQKARECESVLDEIVKNVGDVTSMVFEISTATEEQSVGVTEITKAMNQLDQVTHANAATSQKTAAASSELFAEADEVWNVVETIQRLVTGQSDGAGVPAAKPTSKKPPAQSGGSKPSQKTGARPKNVIALNPTKKSNDTPAPTRKVANGGEFVPSENDPRFTDV